MKVSRPVLIFCIVILLFAGYIQFFTGKKKPPAASVTAAGQSKQAPSPQQQVPRQGSGVAGQVPPAMPGPATAQHLPQMKPSFEKVSTGWLRNPFLLPQAKEDKRKEFHPATKLVAVFQKGNDMTAVIDHDVVKRGDMVGDERVVEIGRDRVVLEKDGARRVLGLMSYEDAERVDELKPKATEKDR